VTLIIVLLPIFFIIAIVILILYGSPVFYYQERMGKNWKPFKIIKFRTMITNVEHMGLNITSLDDERITPFGKILRKFKLDELPQFFNVLKGDMSLIGPRPEIIKFVNYYEDDYNAILKIKPGITDYAAIKFRNEEDIIPRKDPEKFYLDNILPSKIILYKKYIIEIGFFTDMKILFNTIKRLAL
jgi:lipopolysaccharide/colanic/teichoic acid biosynthesis glycosyltransferase